jgi:phosphatidylinositol alpha-1,6-mannosyltransferase
VIFWGRVSDDDLPRCYAACDIFILLSREVPEEGFYEGFGIVYREAMACGKPVVVSKQAGARDMIRPGENGLLVDPTDAHEMIDSLFSLLGDTQSASVMGERAAETARAEVDWSPLNEFT